MSFLKTRLMSWAQRIRRDMAAGLSSVVVAGGLLVAWCSTGS